MSLWIDFFGGIFFISIFDKLFFFSIVYPISMNNLHKYSFRCAKIITVLMFVTHRSRLLLKTNFAMTTSLSLRTFYWALIFRALISENLTWKYVRSFWWKWWRKRVPHFIIGLVWFKMGSYYCWIMFFTWSTPIVKRLWLDFQNGWLFNIHAEAIVMHMYEI